MTHIEVFEPPPSTTGAPRGPQVVDPFVEAFAADVDWLMSQGVSVTRHNLAQEPQAFAAHPIVSALLRHHGDACLPLVLLNGHVLTRGVYPQREELAQLAGLLASASTRHPNR